MHSTRGLMDALSDASASTVFDAQDKRGALPPSIHRLHGTGTVAGPVVTAACAEGSVTGVLAALQTAPRGSVLVVQGAGEWAYVGELLGSEAARLGVVGIVIDGFARDVVRVREVPISLFARGLTPRGAGFGAPGSVGVELTIGETRVRQGDFAVADDDGVTVVAAEDVEQVSRKAEQLARGESDLAASVVAGASLLDHATKGGRTLRDLLSLEKTTP